MNKSCLLKDVVESIKAAGSIAVISHYNPDADAYGSSCALLLALMQTGKEVFCANESKLSERYKFIPGATLVSNSLKSADIALICDCGSLARTGDNFKQVLSSFPMLINIDHHVSNDYFGHLNYVVGSASSTCEIVYELIKEFPLTINSEIATALYTGMSADTGSFRYSSTGAKTMRIAAELIEAGADLEKISSEFWGKRTLAAVKLQSEAIRNIKIHARGALTEVIVSQETYNSTSSVPEDTEDLVERARDIEGVLISVLIKWDEYQWKVSMRSKDLKYNVSNVASLFGGGGHIMAAAFRWKGDLEELRKKLLPELEKVLSEK